MTAAVVCGAGEGARGDGEALRRRRLLALSRSLEKCRNTRLRTLFKRKAAMVIDDTTKAPFFRPRKRERADAADAANAAAPACCTGPPRPCLPALALDGALEPRPVGRRSTRKSHDRPHPRRCRRARDRRDAGRAAASKSARGAQPMPFTGSLSLGANARLLKGGRLVAVAETRTISARRAHTWSSRTRISSPVELPSALSHPASAASPSIPRSPARRTPP